MVFGHAFPLFILADKESHTEALRCLQEIFGQ